MSRLLSARWTLPLLVLSTLLLTGCPEDRKPIPQYSIIALGDGRYTLDGKRMSHGELISALQERSADPDVKRETGIGHRAALQIVPGPKAGFNDVQELVDEVSGLGYRNIITSQ